MQSKLTNRQRRVTEIRDIAVSRAMAHGKWTRIACSRAPGGEIPWFRYEGDGFTLSLRTPFEKRHAPTEVINFLTALRKQGADVPYPTLPWQLEVWPGEGMEICNKVLNVEWDNRGNTLITSFRRGSWEEQILQWQTSEDLRASVSQIDLSTPAARPILRLVTSQTL